MPEFRRQFLIFLKTMFMVLSAYGYEWRGNMLCAFDFDGTFADSKSAYYKTVLLFAAQNDFALPSQLEMDMAFGNPNPPEN
jgi:hypothetical protein